MIKAAITSVFCATILIASTSFSYANGNDEVSKSDYRYFKDNRCSQVIYPDMPKYTIDMPKAVDKPVKKIVNTPAVTGKNPGLLHRIISWIRSLY